MRQMRLHDSRAGFAVALVVAATVTVLVAAACGLLAAWALSQSTEGQKPEGDPQARESRDPRYDYVAFGSTVANLAEGRLTRYVKVNVTLQVRKEHSAGVVELVDGGKKAVFQDWLLAYMSDKQLDEVKGGSAQAKLRRDIQDGFNALLLEYGDYKIDGVLFTEFAIQ